MILDEPRPISLSFKGDGGKLFGLFIVNFLLTAITLGIYYPWAKTKITRYIHSETELEGKPFVFHGTGKEIFIGFIKAVGLLLLVYGLVFLLTTLLGQVGAFLGMILLLAFFIFGVPYAIHGSMRYQTSRTSWNNVHWGYRGNLKEFTQKFIVGYLLTLLTLGIYGAWYAQTLRKYIIGNTRFGNVEFDYNGDGMEYLLLNLKGILLTICTFGIYLFWYSKDIFNYTMERISAKHVEQDIKFSSELTGGALFGHTIVNMLLLSCTLGIAFPWILVRNLRFIYSNIIISGQFNPEKLEDTESAYNDALGEELGGVIDAALS
ncbi:MAG: YjgN family protein [Aureispira sp.]